MDFISCVMEFWNCFFSFFYFWHIVCYFKCLVFNRLTYSAELVIDQSRIFFKLLFIFCILFSCFDWVSSCPFNLLFSFCKLVSFITCSELRFSLLIFEGKSSPWHDDSFGIFVTLFSWSISVAPIYVLVWMTKRFLLVFIMGHITACLFPFFILLHARTCVIVFLWRGFSWGMLQLIKIPWSTV